MIGRTFDNLHQVHLFVTDELGFQVAYNTLKVHAEQRPRKLPRLRSGGWSAEAVESYARKFLRPKAHRGADSAAPTLDGAGVAERRLEADAQVKALHAQRLQLALERDRRQLIPRDLYERDLSARMAFFSNQLDAAVVSQATEAVALVSAGLPALIAAVGGDQAKAFEAESVLTALIPEIAETLLRRKQDWLKSFAAEAVQEVEIEDYLSATEPEAVTALDLGGPEQN